MVEQRKKFIINSFYVGIISLITIVIAKFTVNHLMPFVVGFMIALILKPIVRKFDNVLGGNKWVSIIITMLFYFLVLVSIIWLIFGGIALIQHYIPKGEAFVNEMAIPMANELIAWFEETISNLDPKMATIVDRGLTEVMNAFQKVFSYLSSATLSGITLIVSSMPKLLVSLILSVISSFFFSIDYELIVGDILSIFPKGVSDFLFDFKNGFTVLIGQYLIAYGKLMFITFLELLIGFFILRISSPLSLAAIVSLVDILPVLGTGTVLVPWAIYELIIGTRSVGIGILVLYLIVTVVRNIMEPRVVGKQIGLHPLLTLVSIYIGVRFMGFWGLFIFPVMVTILVTMYQEHKLNIKGYFNGEENLINIHPQVESKSSEEI